MKASTHSVNPIVKRQFFATIHDMNTDNSDEDRIWKIAYEENLIQQKYQSLLEESQQRKDLLKLKTQVVEVQLRKENLLEEEAKLKIRAAEVSWHIVSIDYQISKLNHQKTIERVEENTGDKDDDKDLMEVALEKVKAPESSINLTPYSDSE